MTNFLHEKITHKGMEFTFDGNSKITASNGTFDNPKSNAFSLVQIQDCPGSTDICRKSCYVHGLEKHAPDVHDAYRTNSKNIKEIIINHGTIEIDSLARKFSEWISSNCIEFRWHVSGDIFSLEYSKFIQRVCFYSHDVRFWIYTRSTKYLSPLVNLDNLVVNLSADGDNYHEIVKYANLYKLRICYFTPNGVFPELPVGSVIFPDYNLRGRDMDKPKDHSWWKSLTIKDRGMVCPVDFFGQSEKNRCGKCMRCMS